MKNGFLLLMLWLAVLGACASNPFAKSVLDDDVERMCAIDGGIKVYETVKLPPKRFNEWGQINFYIPTQGEGPLGEGYLLRTHSTYYRKGNPEMSRTHIQVLRKVDMKVLGESISYGRGGGDLIGPWHGSSHNCPAKEYGYIDLFKKLFLVESGP